MPKKKKVDGVAQEIATQEEAATALQRAHDADMPSVDSDGNPAPEREEDFYPPGSDLSAAAQPDVAGIAMSSGGSGNGNRADRMTKARAARKERDPDAPRPRYIVIGQARTSEDWDVLHVAKSGKGAVKWLAESRALIKRVYSEVTVFRAKPVNVVAY